MKLLDELHKVGVLRVGLTGGTYKNSKDMPDELMFDNVYDKQKDLVGGDGNKEIKNSIANKRQKISDKSWALLFNVLLVLSVTVAILFGVITEFGVWFFLLLGILIIFAAKLIAYKRARCFFIAIMLFVAYFFLTFVFLMIAISQTQMDQPISNIETNFSQDATEAALTNADSQAQVIDESEWIDYTGVKSSIFTFRYPKSYEIQESGTSTLVYVDKDEDYDYHVTFTVLDGVIPVPEDCEGLAKGVAAGFKNGEVRHVQSWESAGYSGCEYGINIEQNSNKIYEVSYNLTSKDKTFYITAYAKKLSDLGILTRVTKSFKLK